MTKVEFLKTHDSIRDDVRGPLKKVESSIAWEKLAEEITLSPDFLNKYRSLSWLLKNYRRILNGDFRTFPAYLKVPRLFKKKMNYSSSGRTANDRTYTKEELESLIQDLDKVEF